MSQTRYPSKRVFKSRFSFKIRQHGQQQLYFQYKVCWILCKMVGTPSFSQPCLFIQPTISTKNPFFYQSIFTSLFHPFLLTKSFLQSPITIPFCIPPSFCVEPSQQYTPRIFSLPHHFCQFRLRQGTRDRGSLFSINTVLICPFLLKVWPLITGITITDSLSLRIKKLIYFRCGKPSNLPSLIPSTIFITSMPY